MFLVLSRSLFVGLGRWKRVVTGCSQRCAITLSRLAAFGPGILVGGFNRTLSTLANVVLMAIVSIGVTAWYHSKKSHIKIEHALRTSTTILILSSFYNTRIYVHTWRQEA